MPACCAARFKSSRDANASSSSRRSSSTIRRSATTKSSATSISTTRICEGARVFRQGAARSRSTDPFYRRALAELALNDFAAAAADLGEVITREPKYDYLRAAGLRGHALVKIGEREKRTRCLRRRCRCQRCPKPIQLCVFPRGGRAVRRGARVGRAHPSEEGHHARLHSPARTAMVSESPRPAEVAAREVATGGRI